MLTSLPLYGMHPEPLSYMCVMQSAAHNHAVRGFSSVAPHQWRQRPQNYFILKNNEEISAPVYADTRRVVEDPGGTPVNLG